MKINQLSEFRMGSWEWSSLVWDMLRSILCPDSTSGVLLLCYSSKGWFSFDVSHFVWVQLRLGSFFSRLGLSWLEGILPLQHSACAVVGLFHEFCGCLPVSCVGNGKRSPFFKVAPQIPQGWLPVPGYGSKWKHRELVRRFWSRSWLPKGAPKLHVAHLKHGFFLPKIGGSQHWQGNVQVYNASGTLLRVGHSGASFFFPGTKTPRPRASAEARPERRGLGPSGLRASMRGWEIGTTRWRLQNSVVQWHPFSFFQLVFAGSLNNWEKSTPWTPGDFSPSRGSSSQLNWPIRMEASLPLQVSGFSWESPSVVQWHRASVFQLFFGGPTKSGPSPKKGSDSFFPRVTEQLREEYVLGPGFLVLSQLVLPWSHLIDVCKNNHVIWKTQGPAAYPLKSIGLGTGGLQPLWVRHFAIFLPDHRSRSSRHTPQTLIGFFIPARCWPSLDPPKWDVSEPCSSDFRASRKTLGTMAPWILIGILILRGW